MPSMTDVNADLICSECKSRISRERVGCRTCNSFAQKAYRRANRQMRERYPEEYRAILVQVERGLYAEMTATAS